MHGCVCYTNHMATFLFSSNAINLLRKNEDFLFRFVSLDCAYARVCLQYGFCLVTNARIGREEKTLEISNICVSNIPHFLWRINIAAIEMAQNVNCFLIIPWKLISFKLKEIVFKKNVLKLYLAEYKWCTTGGLFWRDGRWGISRRCQCSDRICPCVYFCRRRFGSKRPRRNSRLAIFNDWSHQTLHSRVFYCTMRLFSVEMIQSSAKNAIDLCFVYIWINSIIYES